MSKTTFEAFLANPSFIEIDYFLKLSRKQYHKKVEVFLCMRNCLDFDASSEFVKECAQIGKLCVSQTLREMMKADRNETEKLVVKYLKATSNDEKEALKKKIGL